MKRNIWIFNHHATGQYLKRGGRHYWFAKFLKNEGYSPIVFSCNTKHGKFENYFDIEGLWIEEKSEEINVPFVIVKSSKYKGNGAGRILNMIRFYRNIQKVAKEYASIHEKPDVIYASSVHPLTLVAGIKLAKFFKVKCICEVRDLWPLSLVEYGYLKEDSLLTKVLYSGEHWIYKNADEIIFTAGGFNDYVLEKGWTKDIPISKVHYINNGTDLKAWKYNQKNYQIKDVDLSNKDIFKVVYAGSIRKVNNLGLLLDTAKELKNTNIVFLIWGDGAEREALEQRVKNESINNVVFKGRVEKKYIPYITSQADLNIAHNKPAKLFRFGISFNKIFDYLAAGKPILCDFESKYNPVIMMNAGIEVKDSSPKNVAESIKKISMMNENEYEEYCANARSAAQQYDFVNLTKELCIVIEK